MEPLVIVDIDGVVADVRHRLRFLEQRPKDWDGFFAAASDDPPHDVGVELVRRLADEHEIVFLTGRPRRLRRETQDWLERHGLGGHRLVMRPERDRRPAAVVKQELLDELSAGRQVAVVIDDDPDVIGRLSRAGYATFHADWEQRALDDDAALREAQEREGRT